MTWLEECGGSWGIVMRPECAKQDCINPQNEYCELLWSTNFAQQFEEKNSNKHIVGKV
jgi:hypothetical protein